MHLEVGFSVTFQNASTGMQENAKVKNAEVAAPTQSAMTMWMGSLVFVTPKIRLYC
jgi:hypothetical protein